MRVVSLVLVFAGLSPLIRADDLKAKKPAVEPTAAEKAFAETVLAARKAMRESAAYSVSAHGKWTLSGGAKERSGSNTVKVTADNKGRLRIDVGTAGEPDAHLVVACDGKSITRHFAAAKLYSVTPCDGTPLDDLQADGVTVPALREMGVDFLARPDVLAVLFAQTLTVEDLGTQEAAAKLRGFRLRMAGGQDVTVRFTAGDKPVPVEVSSVSTLPLDEKRKLTRTLTTALAWDFAAAPTDATFAVSIPKGAEKVDDLADAIHAPDLTDFVGKPLPAVTFTAPDGKTVNPADYQGKSVVVLYAWATWAAPSVADLPKLTLFVDEYTKKGVVFVAVNAGDTPNAVAEFAAKAKFPGVVALDPKGTGLATARMTVIPAVVVVAKDGTVFSYHRGKPDTADKVKADLDRLLG